MAAATFDHFTSLPLELRQRIWELSIEPRRVPVGNFPRDYYNTAPPPSPVPPPAILQVCADARSYLERFYTKAFVRDSRHTWINFDIDTVFIREREIPVFSADIASTRHLSIEIASDSEYFHRFLTFPRPKLLENLELRPCGTGNYDWFLEWDGYLQDRYYRANPVPFRTTIVSPLPDHPVPELNPDNYLKVRRDRVRRRWREEPPDHLEPGDWEPRDSDDEDPCEPGWRHAPDCTCPRPFTRTF